MAGRRDAYAAIFEALEQTGLEWRRVDGKKHVKLYLANCLVGTLPHGKASTSTASVRATKNLLKRIERAAQEIKATGAYNALQH